MPRARPRESSLGCGIEAKLLDTDGTLDLPPELDGRRCDLRRRPPGPARRRSRITRDRSQPRSRSGERRRRRGDRGDRHVDRGGRAPLPPGRDRASVQRAAEDRSERARCGPELVRAARRRVRRDGRLRRDQRALALPERRRRCDRSSTMGSRCWSAPTAIAARRSAATTYCADVVAELDAVRTSAVVLHVRVLEWILVAFVLAATLPTGRRRLPVPAGGPAPLPPGPGELTGPAAASRGRDPRLERGGRDPAHDRVPAGARLPERPAAHLRGR